MLVCVPTGARLACPSQTSRDFVRITSASSSQLGTGLVSLSPPASVSQRKLSMSVVESSTDCADARPDRLRDARRPPSPL